ncbi:MAG: type II toxin-antitoxin system VapC family toxin [Planctomycetota bacterium]
MRVLVDTNIIARCAQPSHPQHALATSALNALASRREMLCLASQNLYEFWVVSTRPVGENGLGFTTAESHARLMELEGAFTVLEDTPALRRHWIDLVVRHDVKGKSGHDARLVAAMQVHGIGCILTFDTPGFSRFPGIEVLSPDALLPASETKSG